MSEAVVEAERSILREGIHAPREIPIDFFRLSPSVAQGRLLVTLVRARDFGMTAWD